jgi:hypothetical protein
VVWSLATVAPNRELATSRALTRCEFDNVVFKIRRRSVYRGRANHRLLAAFPSYIWLTPKGAWAYLRERFGITHYIGHGSIIETAMTSLLKVADSDSVIPTPEIISPRFKSGDRVIYRGENIKWLADRSGEFQFLIDENKAMIEIEWCGRPVPIQVDERDLVLEVAEKPKPKRRKRHRRRRRHNAVDHNRRLDIPAAGS